MASVFFNTINEKSKQAILYRGKSKNDYIFDIMKYVYHNLDQNVDDILTNIIYKNNVIKLWAKSAIFIDEINREIVSTTGTVLYGEYDNNVESINDTIYYMKLLMICKKAHKKLNKVVKKIYKSCD
jgi:hypothetical protein